MAELVEAKIIETDIDLVKLVDVEVVQKAIVDATDAIKRADEKIAQLDYERLDEIEPKQLKKFRASLNESIREIGDCRKRAKSELMKPYDLVDAEIKTRTEKLKELEGRYAAQVRANDAAIKEARRAHMREVYESFAGELASVIPYERVEDPSWLNAAGWQSDGGELSNPKHEEALYDNFGRVIKDYEALCAKEGAMHDFAAAKALFFECLDLGAVLRADDEAKRRDEEIAEMERRVAENRAAMQQAQEQQEPQEPQEQWPEEEPEPTLFYQLTVSCTARQKDMLVAFLKRCGIHGTIREVRNG